MEITASMVKDLRERTGTGMMECKTALVEAGGNIDAAIAILRKKGLSAGAKKAHRETSEGLVGSYIHVGGKIGVMVEINCETDFVARTTDFQQLVKDISMHVAASAPRFVGREEVTPELLAAERAIYTDQAAKTGKPAAVVEKIVDGKIEKFYAEACLLEQPFVKDPSITVKDLVSSVIGKLGENIRIKRFARFVLGESVEAKQS
ncbi:MAG TPA: translation elongation factor Ts [Patescibacteria group bacterium]|jgi:elongation factor Ts|nr:translation elongation factor Ts [Patescibacteria group bacterium]